MVWLHVMAQRCWQGTKADRRLETPNFMLEEIGLIHFVYCESYILGFNSHINYDPQLHVLFLEGVV